MIPGSSISTRRRPGSVHVLRSSTLPWSVRGEVVLESLVQPTRRIPADATAIHGITNADVKHAPAWCDLYEDCWVLAGRRVIVNVIFDRQMVNQACDRYDLAAPAADWECAMRKYAGFTEMGFGQALVPVPEAGARRARLRSRARRASRRCRCHCLPCCGAGMAAPHLCRPAPAAPLDTKRTWHVPAEQAAIPWQ